MIMKRISLVLLTVLCGISLSNSLNAQGKTLSEKRNVSAFGKIQVGDDIELFLTQGDEQLVRVETDNHAIDNLTTEVVDGTLYLKVSPLQKKSKLLAAYVTVRDLKGISAVGKSVVVLKTPMYTKDDIDINLSESAVIKDGELSGNDVSVKMTGSAQIKGMKLKGKSLTANMSGSAEASFDVACSNVTVSTENKSDLQVKGKTDKLSVVARNSSTVKSSSLKFQASIIDTADGASYKN